MRSGLNVRGLNTAGTLWCSAAVGVLAGSGLIAHAGLGAGSVLLVNVAFRPFAKLLNRHPASGRELKTYYRLFLTCRGKKQACLRQTLVDFLRNSDLRLQELETAAHSTTGHIALQARLMAAERIEAKVEKLAHWLSLEPGVTGMSWHAVSDPKSEGTNSLA